MTRDPFNEPTTRNWRDIPQPVKPRAMSRGGRWRLALATLRATGLVAVGVLLLWGGWKIVGVVQQDPRAMPAAAKAVPLRRPELVTSSGGVLHSAWLERTLALPKNISLMEVNLKKTEARVLAENQVLTAKVTRRPPDRLIVEITERMPVARVMADWRGREQPLLVARDGVVFAGEGYSAAVMESLPWLAGVKLKYLNEDFVPVAGMEVLDELLVKAQAEAAHLCRSWKKVSLARLATDREIVVTTEEGFRITFGVSEPRATDLARRKNFLDQLARLDVIWEKVSRLPVLWGTIDLSHGSDVPVHLEPIPGAEAASGAPVRATANAKPFPSFSAPLIPSHREL